MARVYSAASLTHSQGGRDIQIFAFIVVGLVAIFLFSLGISAAKEHVQRLNDAFRGVARSRGGRCIPGDLWQLPALRFPFENGQVLLNFLVTGGKHKVTYTQLHLPNPHPDFRLTLETESLASDVGKLFGMVDIQLGDPRFDATFLLKSKDEESVRETLDEATRDWIYKLLAFRGYSKLSITFSESKILIRKEESFLQEDLIQEYIELGIGLYHCLSGKVPSLGISFLSKRPLRPQDSTTVCQICGEEIHAQEAAVRCASCRTPHHRDCWDYIGCCSTYACGETKAVSG